ncbi:MAG: glycosyltransferase [Candidatus Paceibacterota bacterium]
MKNIALVTVTYNAGKNLPFFLPSLVQNKEIISHVYFVDNNSKDTTLSTLETFKKLEEESFDVHIISNRKNYGYTHAVNSGIQKALDDGFKYICVTNNDIAFEHGFFAKMLSEFTENTIDALGVPASINEHDLGLGYSLDSTTYAPKKDQPIKRKDIQREILKNPLPSIDFPHGGTILFSRYFFENIGLYDHHLFFGGDELDFLYRVTAYNAAHDTKIKCAVSLTSFLKLDNLSHHNNGNKFIKARGMLQGNARVHLKHTSTPFQSKLYREQHSLIQSLAKGSLMRYIALYLFALRGLCIEIYRYYRDSMVQKITS